MPDKILSSQPQFAVGEAVEASIGGGETYPGQVTAIRPMKSLSEKKLKYQYQVDVKLPSGKRYSRWFRDYEIFSAQGDLNFSPTAAKPVNRPSKFRKGELADLPLVGGLVRVIIKNVIFPNFHQNNYPPQYYVQEVSGKGNSRTVREEDLRPLQNDLFANWLEKSRDMYRVDQKPIGRDRKQVEGPFPRSISNTWLELPMDKPLSKKIAAGKCGMCGAPMTGSTCPRCKYTPTKKQFYGTRVTAGDVLPFRPKQQDPYADQAREIGQEEPEQSGSELVDGLLYQFDMLKGDLQNLMTSAQSWASESTDPQEIVRLKRMSAKLQAILKIIQQ